jgi:uncharacterized protein
VYPDGVERTGSALCLACGMCCDGTLFHTVELTADEVEPWRRRGLTVLTDHDVPRFTQPCPHHQGGGCSIYGDRPSTCERFRCPLLLKYMADELSEEECLARVAQVRALAESIRAATQSAPERRTLRAEIHAHLEWIGAAGAMENPEWLRNNAEFLMDLKSLEILMVRDFLPPRQE